MKSTVLLVDDQPAIAEAHRTLPEDYPEIGTIMVAHGEDDYWAQYKRNRSKIDVVVMDLMLETAIPISANEPTPVKFSGFTLIEKTLAKWPKTKFIVFSQYLHETNVLHAYRMGARCFLSKHQNSMDEFAEAITAVSNGEIVVPEMYSLAVKNKVAAYQDDKLCLLSDEQLSILEMILNGYRTEDIREAINSTSSAATRNKISKLLKLVGITDRADLILYAVNAGLVPKKM